MYTFLSPAGTGNLWKLEVVDDDTMKRVYYDGRTAEEGTIIYGCTDYMAETVFINENLFGFNLQKVVLHELAHVFLWETGQQAGTYNEENVADIISVATIRIFEVGLGLVQKIEKREEYDGV